jgi:hypothetical protein
LRSISRYLRKLSSLIATLACMVWHCSQYYWKFSSSGDRKNIYTILLFPLFCEEFYEFEKKMMLPPYPLNITQIITHLQDKIFNKNKISFWILFVNFFFLIKIPTLMLIALLNTIPNNDAKIFTTLGKCTNFFVK